MKTISQDLLGEAARRLAEEFHPGEIWPFGSHAWGQPHDDSDVDFMVIVSHSDDRAIKRIAARSPVPQRHRVPQVRAIRF